MNKEHAGEVLGLLGAAVELSRVYGVDHIASRAASQRLVAALGRVAPKETVSIAFTGEGVVVGRWLVHDRGSADSGLAGALPGITLVRLHPGVQNADVTELIGGGAKGDAWRSASGKIECGGGVNADRGLPARGARGPSDAGVFDVSSDGSLDSEEVTRGVRESWELVLAGQDPGEERFGAIAARLVSSLTLADAGSLPLLQLKEHDEYTYVHAVNVGLIASALGQAVGLSGELLHKITEAALLHDVGKSLIPPGVLNKPAKLDDAERLIMQRHPVIGAAMLAGVKGVNELAVVAAHEHHLRVDGGGYPHFNGRRFPSLVSQLIQIADIFDALRSDRPYRAGLPGEKCLEIMSRDSGAGFDSRLFDLFCQRIVKRVA